MILVFVTISTHSTTIFLRHMRVHNHNVMIPRSFFVTLFGLISQTFLSHISVTNPIYSSLNN
jgi:hypothetical protein